MRLKRCMASCFVASPIDSMVVSEATPMMTPSIMRRLRTGLREIIFSAIRSVRTAFK